MKEYIDREGIKESLRESYVALNEIYKGLTTDIEKRLCGAQLGAFMEAIIRIKDFPAADVVEVVRCKDCKLSRELNKSEREIWVDGVRKCNARDRYVWPYEFCYDGTEGRANDR